MNFPTNVPADMRASHVGNLRKALYGTRLGIVSRCDFRDHSGSVAGAVHGDDIFVAGPREVMLKLGRCSRSDGRLEMGDSRSVFFWLGSGNQKELHILNRTLRWCRDGWVFAADVRHVKDVIQELALAT